MTASIPDVQRAVQDFLSEASGGPVTVRALRPLLGGACQDNLRVDAVLASGEERTWVLRSDAPGSLPESLRRDDERRVIEAALAAGVCTPPARWPSVGLLRAGAQAYFLDWREGVAIGRKLVRDEGLAAAREGLPRRLAEELARIHAITPASRPELRDALGDPPDDPVQQALWATTASLDALGEPRPALEAALAWLRAHAPAASEVTLAHGDFRTGNFLVTPDGLSAVLDWEFARWSTPAEDLAWLCLRDWRFGRLDRPVGGFGERAPFLAAYTEASGRALTPDELHWWEVLGNVRWAGGSLHQGRRYLAGERDLELAAIARRAEEMEYEALRLVDRRPTWA